MSVMTDLTRMWLTRSTKPFTFLNEYDETLDYGKSENLGLYVHIPFCEKICSFCPYCKVLYSKENCDAYIDALLQEIHMVSSQYEGKKQVTSLYFGGGTPALAVDRLGEIIEAIKEHFIVTEGIGLELHPRNVNEEMLTKLKALGITKISIGIQSFQEKYQSILDREVVDREQMALALSQVKFETVSMDFIFALPNQTYQDLKTDMELAFSHGVG